MNRLYIVVREDLPPGLQIAQSCHALRTFAADYPELDAAWYANGNNIVVLRVADERTLVTLGHDLYDQNVRVSYFTEPDLDDETTAIACEESAKPFLRRLQLALAA